MTSLSGTSKAVADLEDVLSRHGFVRCDIPACNCGSWHARYGLPERMNEIKDMLSEAGHPLCNDNGNLVRNALRELIAERDRLATQPAEAVRQPLTDDEITDLWAEASIDHDDAININELARAIERAHGITGAQE